MRRALLLAVFPLMLFSGCDTAPPPRERVVEREYIYDQNTGGEREVVVVQDDAPAPYVEVVPIAPYPGAFWVRGYWVRGHRHWMWMHGYWR